MLGNAIEITDELIAMAGERYLPDGLGGGVNVKDLPSWRHHDFRRLIAGFLASGLVKEDAEARYRKEQDDLQRERVKRRMELIPDIYRVNPDPHYARQSWDSAREYTRHTRVDVMKHKPAQWLYIYGKSGRGKSHMAGQVLSALAHHADVAWINCEALDAEIKASAGGDKGAEEIKRAMIHEAMTADIIVLDDLGKADTVSDGVSLPTRIQPLHSIIEGARTAAHRRCIIVTSEYMPTQLEKRISLGVVNRILEGSQQIVIDEVQTYREYLSKKSEKST